MFYACQFFQCCYWLEDEDGYCTGGCLLIMPRGLEKKEQDRNESLYEQCGGWVGGWGGVKRNGNLYSVCAGIGEMMTCTLCWDRRNDDLYSVLG